jgi:ribosome-binding factor A
LRYQRSQRVSELLHHEISRMVQFELKDPRIGFVTLTGVDVTSDIQHAKIFFTVMGDEESRRKTQAGLDKSIPFIRRELGRRLHLRTIPELSFQYDKSIEYGARIETLLKESGVGEVDDQEDS